MSKKIFFSLLFLVLLIAMPAVSAWASFTYTPMEKIPGFDTGSNFCTYITAVYNFGLWTIGICAMFMIMIGGYMYIMSAGNNASMGKAKGVIFDAVIGLMLALVAYLILYVINPDLVQIRSICGTQSGGTQPPPGGGGSQPPPGGGGTQPPPGGAGAFSCSDNGCTVVNDAVSNNSSGVDPNVLKTVLTAGEKCNSGLSTDGHGSCGYSQAKPIIRTWCGISGTDAETCAKVQADTNLDVNCAAKLIKSRNGSCPMSNIREVGSCYNSGKPNNCAKTTADYCGRLETYLNNC